MELFIILTVLFYFPFLMYYFAYRKKKNGVVNPFRNRLRMLVILINVLLFAASIIMIYFFSENEFDWNEFWIKLPILSLGISAVPFFFYLKELLELKWDKLDKTAAKIEMWNSKSLLRNDYDRFNKVILIGTENSYNCYYNKWDLSVDDEKLRFLNEGVERTGSPRLIGLVAFHVMHFKTLDLYDATNKGKKAIVIEEMFNYLNTYFDLEVFKDNKTLKDSDNKSKYFTKENREDIHKYIDQYEKLK